MWIKKQQINKGARLNHPVQSSGEINPKHVQSDIGETFWNLKLTVYILMTFRFKVYRTFASRVLFLSLLDCYSNLGRYEI